MTLTHLESSVCGYLKMAHLDDLINFTFFFVLLRLKHGETLQFLRMLDDLLISMQRLWRNLSGFSRIQEFCEIQKSAVPCTLKSGSQVGEVKLSPGPAPLLIPSPQSENGDLLSFLSTRSEQEGCLL